MNMYYILSKKLGGEYILSLKELSLFDRFKDGVSFFPSYINIFSNYIYYIYITLLWINFLLIIKNNKKKRNVNVVKSTMEQ